MLGTYLNAATPDCTSGTLTVRPHNTITYEPARMQKVITYDGPQESRISIDSGYSFMVDVQWELLPASNSGTVIDFLLGWDKANGIVRSFKWQHPTDGYVYVVRAAKLPSRVTITQASASAGRTPADPRVTIGSTASVRPGSRQKSRDRWLRSW